LNVGNYNDNDCKIFLALLYWCEGEKTGKRFCFSNSDPVMVKVYLALLRRAYKIDNKKCSPVIGIKQLHKDELKAFCSDTEFLFGNSFDKQINITASSVAAWAYLFGRDLLNFDYDYLEPEYFGNPFLKKTKVEK
jgi:hypothetical protein